MYFDAHVLEIERKRHDIRGCRCQFLIRYDHGRTEVTTAYTLNKKPSFLLKSVLPYS